MGRIIATYLTFTSGVPTAVGTSFSPHISQIDIQMSNNFSISDIRDGSAKILYDPHPHVERKGTLTLLTSDSDLSSNSTYLGDYRFLDPVLYDSYRQHFPILITQQSSFKIPYETAKKCYLAYITGFDTMLAGWMTPDTASMHLLGERFDLPKTFQINLEIYKDGIFTDIADITTVTWNARGNTPAYIAPPPLPPPI